IFERFGQSESAQQSSVRGTGLGLAICKTIIDEHDGQIGVISEPGQGSEFWFSISLPRQVE
ncbi:MAG: two-component sensor histidine kinase, partial [Candidatus Obscuribacterales bacterium]|nr:two-component sensor histidine kinase [Candidatus Obscuribacterales bacterium]